jgi:hypothetical protein
MLHSVFASYHQGAEQFSTLSRGKQCVCMSYISLLHQMTKPCKDWNLHDLNYILLEGDKLYLQLKQSKSIVTDYLLVSDIPIMVRLNGTIYERHKLLDIASGEGEPIYCGNSQLLESSYPFYTFSDPLTKALQYSSQVMLIIGSYGLALHRGDEHFYLFDSHSCDSVGHHVADGTTALFCYESIHHIALHCFKTFQAGSCPFSFDVVPVCINVFGVAHSVCNAIDTVSPVSLGRHSACCDQSHNSGYVNDKYDIDFPPLTSSYRGLSKIRIGSDNPSSVINCDVQQYDKTDCIPVHLAQHTSSGEDSPLSISAVQHNYLHAEKQKATNEQQTQSLPMRKRSYYEKNKERINANRRADYQQRKRCKQMEDSCTNPLNHKQRRKRYYNQNKEAINASRRAKNQQHKIERQAKYQEKITQMETSAIHPNELVRCPKEMLVYDGAPPSSGGDILPSNFSSIEPCANHSGEPVPLSVVNLPTEEQNDNYMAFHSTDMACESDNSSEVHTTNSVNHRLSLFRLCPDANIDVQHFNKCVMLAMTISCSHCNILLFPDSNITCVDLDQHLCSDNCVIVCGKCKKYVVSKNVAPWSLNNDMDAGCQPDCLKTFTCMELRLISQIIPFMKFVRLKGGQFGEVGQAISFPVNIPKVHSILPRTMKDSELFYLTPQNSAGESALDQVNHRVRYSRVLVALAWLKDHNPLYKDVVIDSGSHNAESESDNSAINESVNFIESCAMSSSYVPPNVSLQNAFNSDFQRTEFPRITSKPASIFTEERTEELCFPHLYPFGKCGLKHQRQPPITDLEYFRHRLLCTDVRWRKDFAWIFWALNTFEIRKLYSSINIVTRTRTQTAGDSQLLTASGVITGLDSSEFISNSYSFMKNIRGTAAYWRDQLHNLLAKINTLGAPTWFLTLSANDHWPDLLKNLAPDLTEEQCNNMTGQKRWDLFTTEPIKAAVHFNRRFNAFIRLILKSKNEPLGHIQDYWYRIEFQMRGSPHVHMFLWVEGAPKLDTVDGMRDAPGFIDKYVSTCMPQDKNSDLFSLVKTCQIHKHTVTCNKRNMRCRFSFPRPISSVTTLKTNVDLMSSARFYETKRGQTDQWVNAYNPSILSAWRANMDLQMIGSKYAAAFYVCTYVSKAEPEKLKLALSQLMGNMSSDISFKKKLAKIGNVVLSHRQVSAQEVAFRMCHLPLVGSTRQTVWVNSCKPEKRYCLLKPVVLLRALANDSTDIFMSGISQYYALRPTTTTIEGPDWDKMSLNVFAAMYNIVSVSPNTTSRTLPSFKLTNMDKWAKQRRKPAIISSSCLSASDGDDYYYHLVYLYIPWREENMILDGFDSAKSTFLSKRHLADINIPQCSTSELERAITQIRLLDPDSHDRIAVCVAPNTAELGSADAINPQWSMQNAALAEHSDSTSSDAIDLSSSLHDTSLAWHQSDSFTMNNEDFLNMMQQLSPDQKTVLETIRKHFQHPEVGKAPMRLFITEFIIRTASKPGFPGAIITAPTGVASFRIGGRTIHSALSLPVEHGARGRGGAKYLPLSNKKLFELRQFFRQVHTLIIDEISMVSRQTMEYIHLRLAEIKDTTQNADSYFGDMNILTFGDLFQLKPVFGSFIFKNFFLDELHLWKLYTPLFLTANHRQCNDPTYTAMLNRIRTGVVSIEDVNLLQTRIIDTASLSDPPFAESLRIFPTKILCKIYNDACLEKLVASSHSVSVEVKASNLTMLDGPPQYSDGAADIAELISDNTSDTAGIMLSVQLSVASRVMLVRNIMSSQGLVNGAQGSVHGFLWPDGTISGDPPHQTTCPVGIYILLDNKNVGKILQNSTQHNSILIEPITVRFYGKHNSVFQMTQFPIIPSFASTVHKVQGLTLDRAVIDLGDDLFTTGQAYVALSRVRSLEGLAITKLSPRKIRASPQVIVEMSRLHQIQDTLSN